MDDEINKSSISGRIVSDEEAKQNPDETYTMKVSAVIRKNFIRNFVNCGITESTMELLLDDIKSGSDFDGKKELVENLELQIAKARS